MHTPKTSERRCVCFEGRSVKSEGGRQQVQISLLQAVDAVEAVLAGALSPTLVGGRAAAGAGGEVHLAFGVLVHQSAEGGSSQ